jgi:hypothetical protein
VPVGTDKVRSVVHELSPTKGAPLHPTDPSGTVGNP